MISPSAAESTAAWMVAASPRPSDLTSHHRLKSNVIEDELLLTELHYNGDGLLDSRVETDKSAYNAGSRSWTYSYYTGGDNDGLLHQVDGPRTRVADLTTYKWVVYGDGSIRT